MTPASIMFFANLRTLALLELPPTAPRGQQKPQNTKDGGGGDYGSTDA